jgi:hypothetical protein
MPPVWNPIGPLTIRGAATEPYPTNFPSRLNNPSHRAFQTPSVGPSQTSDAAQLERLVNPAKGGAAPTAQSAQGADVQTYVIRIEQDGATHELRGSDLGEPLEFAALRRFIEAKGG